VRVGEPERRARFDSWPTSRCAQPSVPGCTRLRFRIVRYRIVVRRIGPNRALTKQEEKERERDEVKRAVTHRWFLLGRNALWLIQCRILIFLLPRRFSAISRIWLRGIPLCKCSFSIRAGMFCCLSPHLYFRVIRMETGKLLLIQLKFHNS